MAFSVVGESTKMSEPRSVKLNYICKWPQEEPEASNCRRIPDGKEVSEHNSLTHMSKPSSIRLAQTKAVHQILAHFLVLLLLVASGKPLGRFTLTAD